ncbi:MAG: hypothetical protein HRT42_14210, partial [Campylobacteraceae bacterium]|nr:hypothetical protein [Campylobacteraceae bacterium]
MICDECGRYFPNKLCYDSHLKITSVHKTLSTCEFLHLCKICGLTYKTTSNHVCGIPCKACKVKVIKNDPSHRCFMGSVKTGKRKNGIEKKFYTFFDVECSIEPFNNLSAKSRFLGRHKPVLIVAQRVCVECVDVFIADGECLTNDCTLQIFSGLNCVSKFCQWLFKKENEHSIVLGHNSSKYDMYLIINELFKYDKIIKVLCDGSRYLTVQLVSHDIKFVDTYNYIKQPLHKFSEIFGIFETKGYFPHLFNVAENANYLGILPDVKYYSPDTMKGDTHALTGVATGERGIFLDWYDENKNSVFDLNKELIKYCKIDVNLLSKGALIFHKSFYELTTIEPFIEAITLAQACNQYFRNNLLEKDCLAIIPPGGFHSGIKYSMISQKWLLYQEMLTDSNIHKYLDSNSEYKIDQYSVDGYSLLNDTIYSFYGCWWHGCCQCYSDDTLCANGTEAAELYTMTMKRKEFFLSKGHKVVDIWECDFNRLLEQDDKARNFVQNLDISKPLIPISASAGGRTECFMLKYKIKAGEEIHYLDVRSLYPSINKNIIYPIKYPEIIKKDFLDDISKYCGLIHCRILPPFGLHLPVLPKRCSKKDRKLLFPLCYMCAKNRVFTDKCEHSELDRSLKDTWVLDEVLLAIEKGYKILKIYEIWHFPNVLDPSKGDRGLFTQYVDLFIKIKAESSGWPASCTTEEKKNEYILNFFKIEKVFLEKKNIKKNLGLRNIAKTCLNLIWGKFQQQLDKDE